MPVCAHCACDIDGDGNGEFHGYHADGDTQWSRDNRAWCDFFHRGVVLPRKLEAHLVIRPHRYEQAEMEEAVTV